MTCQARIAMFSNGPNSVLKKDVARICTKALDHTGDHFFVDGELEISVVWEQ